MRGRLLRIFDLLLEHFGQRHWWPGDTPLEISIGAILTQNCAWRNVEKAIDNLKGRALLELNALHRIGTEELAEIIRPCGFYNIKAKRLQFFTRVLVEEYSGSFESLNGYGLDTLRERFLAINGIGPETADSILLYALGKPTFVIDAYTKRFVRNHGLAEAGNDLAYDNLQLLFMDHLPADTYLYNEFHALIVRLCQTYCKKVPLCARCPLKGDRGLAEGLTALPHF
ncbi:MAG TPA: endonuclease [Deltaproteobacteria bacterium]|nr:endonuclease [Deltaproteobacteria bacterium]